MSLARALTKRYKQQEALVKITSPTRTASTRRFDGPIDRRQISLPIELLSTTNVLAYDAPDLYKAGGSPASSTRSFSDSDSSQSLHSSSSISSPETSSIGSSPTSPEHNHLSTYFQAPGQAISSTESRESSASLEADVPAVPSRALSHTKKSHQILARKRSQSQFHNLITPTSPTTTMITRSSLDLFSSKPDTSHPFGAELAQVNELAEEFGANEVTIWDEEEQYLTENGLQKFGVNDYLMEITGLYGAIFEDRPFSVGTGWI
ncbi:hypothetical protein MMC14_002096 [Varicellaria rhodocarpa]|nr:hypothetical protein [Varicellaria rhodocarpa]